MHNAFNPQEIALLVKVVDEACAAVKYDEAQKATVAARVIAFAAKGARDYETLLAVATCQSDVFSTPLKVPGQREYMRRLVRGLGSVKAKVCAAYARAERDGLVRRQINTSRLSPEEYAVKLWNDGQDKDWLRK